MKRRRWRGPPEAQHHVDDWLMTYADMITLLLCFFAIFLSVTVAKKEAPRVEVALPTAAPPQPPRQFTEVRFSFRDLPQIEPSAGEGRLPSPTKRAPPADAPTIDPFAAERRALADLHVVPPFDLAEPPPAKSAAPPAPVAAPAPAAARASESESEKEKGDRITILELNSATFFDRGSAVLSQGGAQLLAEAAVKLAAPDFRDYQVTVEGHTDDSPISTPQFPSNWELSTARAAAVVHFFLEHGIPAPKLRAAGYADTFPKLPNRDANGIPIPENQALNRRVVIKLEKIERAKRAG